MTKTRHINMRREAARTTSGRLRLPAAATRILAALLLLPVVAACTQSEVLDNPDILWPVQFGAYSLPTGGATTRADINDEAALQAAGFGVFAYYTDNNTYPTTNSTYIPNFMYNQKVEGNSGAWSYTPLKYWPNEHGSAAQSTDVDKVSFFAYAPWRAASATGSIQVLTSNATATDPKISYQLPANPTDKPDDLLWAVDPTTGLPHRDKSKTGLNEKVNFRFRHALASIKPTVQAVIDQASPTGDAVDSHTRITIDEVIIKAKNQASSAVLNLNNTEANKPRWESIGALSTKTFTINAANSNINTELTDLGTGLAQAPAVTNTAKNLMSSANTALPVIPHATSQELEVEAKYHVTTYDDDITSWSVLNDITNTVTIPNLAAGNQYTLNMLLGMETIKFDVTVGPMKDAWGDELITDIGGNSKTWAVNAQTSNNGDGTISSWNMDDPYIDVKWSRNAILKLENSLIYSYVLDAKKNSENHPYVIVQYKVTNPSNWYLRVHWGEVMDTPFINYSNSNHTYTPASGQDYEEVKHYVDNNDLKFLYGDTSGTPTGYISWYSGEGGPIKSGNWGYNENGLNPFISFQATGVQVLSIKYIPK